MPKARARAQDLGVPRLQAGGTRKMARARRS